MLLGRAPDCDIRLRDEETSRHHAEILDEKGVIVVRDNASTNGTYINGERVASAELRPGSICRWGGTVAIICLRDLCKHPKEFGLLAEGMWGGTHLEAALAQAKQAANTTLPIVIEGETGTGKERIALAIHEWSQREGRFIAINCAAIPEGLAEAELFGYRRGAFTNALQPSPGYLRSADRGTLLLDEVYALPLVLQAKLLRVLEEREVTPVGESTPKPVDVRIIATAQEPLTRSVSEGSFRADLYARLAGLTVHAPALRDRREDIPALFNQFFGSTASPPVPKIRARVIERLLQHDFPLNVRELRLLAHRLAALSAGEAELTERLLGPLGLSLDGSAEVASNNPKQAAPPALTRKARRSVELQSLKAALAVSSGNVVQAARIAGISRQRAYRLLDQQGMAELAQLREPSVPPTTGME